MVNYSSTATILLSLLSTSSIASSAATTNNNGAKFNLRKRIIGRPINTNNHHKLSQQQQHDDTDTAATIEQEQYHRTLQLQENSMSMPPLQQSQLVIDGSPEGEPTVGPPANMTQIEQAAWWDSFLNSGRVGTPYPTYYPTYSPTSADADEEEETDAPVSSPVSEAPVSAEPTESVAKATATDSPSTPPVSASPTDPPVSAAPTTSAPVTSTPTSTPITSSPITPYPTYSPTIDPPLLTKANNLGSIFGPGMYTECQGDCDTHSDCLGDNYMCFYRDDNELVPGCDNESAVRGIDYCVERTNEILQEVESVLVGEGGYGRCEGNCNSDSDCQGELLCQERNGWDLIYGCVGWGEENVNYCREKTDDEKVGQLLITDVYSGIIMNSNEVVETEEEAVAGGVVAGSTEVSPVDKRTPKVIKLMDDTSSYFVGYNGKQVTITKIDKETDEISLDGVVLNSDDTHVISDWKNVGTDLVISASEMEDGYASIDIQLQEAEPPSLSPEMSPTGGPSTLTPSGGPSTLSPTKLPTPSPSTSPTPVPTATPSLSPSSSPTKEPSSSPTESPTFSPTKNPTASPTLACGNTICELELSEDPDTCPTDCIFRNYISRDYERNEKSNGHMFTVSASDQVTIGYLGIVAEKDGNSDIQVYTKSGSHTGFEEDETAWTLIFDNTVSVVKESFTSLKLDSEITIEAGSSQAFYIFSKVGLLYHKIGKRRELEGLTLTFDADKDTEEDESTIAEAKNDKNQDEGDVVPAVVTIVGDSTITISQMVGTKKLFKDVLNVVAVYTGGISYYMSARDVA